MEFTQRNLESSILRILLKSISSQKTWKIQLQVMYIALWLVQNTHLFLQLFINDKDIRQIQYYLQMRLTILLVLIISILCVDYDWTEVENQVSYYLQEGAFTGGILKVANGKSNIFTKPFGYFTHNNIPYGSIPFTNESLFDIASLTKVSATLTCIMHLFDQGIIDVEDPVIKYIPEYNNHGKQATLVKNLLLHNAGLIPDYPGNQPDNKSQVMEWVYNCSLNYTIGTKMVYSDLSFILLGQISERVSKKKLQVYAKELMLEMGMPNSTYLPKSSELPRIPPTEYSKVRQTLIRGVVHDPTAYAFGGVAGHAGFFSVAQDLQTYMQIHLNKGLHRNGTRIYKSATVEKFYQREDGLPYNNRRALGWDTVPIQTYPPCGTLFSLNSFGHTGYTGTMMWADREKNLIVVLLTQRVHPTAESLKIIQARSKIVDEVVRTLGLGE